MYHNYILCLFHDNKLDFYTYPTQLKFALEIEYIIGKNIHNENKFYKYKFICDNL